MKDKKEAKKVASAILEGLTMDEKKVFAKILMADDATVKKELGHNKDDVVRSFAKVALKNTRKRLQNENG